MDELPRARVVGDTDVGRRPWRSSRAWIVVLFGHPKMQTATWVLVPIAWAFFAIDDWPWRYQPLAILSPFVAMPVAYALVRRKRFALENVEVPPYWWLMPAAPLLFYSALVAILIRAVT